jgi:hypothetical protein
MTQRTVHASGRDVPLGIYVAGIRKAKENPGATFRHGLNDGGFPTPTSGRDILREFRRGMHDRINQGVPYALRGLVSPWPRHTMPRKLSYDYQAGLYRDAKRLEGYGGFGRVLETPEVRRRVGDHVHCYVNGMHRVCDDLECEMRH